MLPIELLTSKLPVEPMSKYLLDTYRPKLLVMVIPSFTISTSPPPEDGVFFTVSELAFVKSIVTVPACAVIIPAMKSMIRERGLYKYMCFISYVYSNSYLAGRGGYWRVQPSQRRRMTPKKASPKMPPDILLVPSLRLTKMTGTSLILKPMRHAVNFISIWKP